MSNLFNRNDGTFATVGYSDLAGQVSLTSVTKATTANITLSSSAFVDGPSVSQGSSGTWYASGSVTLGSSNSAAQFMAKLWDGATVIASGDNTSPASSLAGGFTQIALSGVLASPAGNLRISVAATTAVGTIFFNQTGNSLDSIITAVRIG